MSQSGLARISSGNLPPAVPLQFTGDNGTIAVPSGNNITIYADVPHCGVSVTFDNSGSTSLLSITDNKNNMFLGSLAGPTGAYTGSTNVGVGPGSMNTTTGSNNVAVGYIALSLNSTGGSNTAIGDAALSELLTGRDNIAIGSSAGSFYDSNESGNIVIGETGNAGDQNTTYIGTQGFISKCLIAGITGVSVSNPMMVTINSSTGQLGSFSTAGSAVLLSTGSSQPQWSAPMTNGQVVIGSTSGTPVASTLTAGSGITITNAAGSITIAATATGFTPNSTVNLSDDFINSVWTSASGVTGTMSWTTLGSTTPIPVGGTTSSAHPGIVQNIGLASASSSIYAASKPMILGAGAISINWVVNVATLSTGTNTYTFIVGLGDVASTEPANGVYFLYTNGTNSGAWVGKTAAASVRSSANSGNTVSAGAWVNLGITINAAATSCAFFVNGVQITNSPLSSNIPTLGLGPVFSVIWSAGIVAAGSVMADLVYMTQTLTTPR